MAIITTVTTYVTCYYVAFLC